MGIQVEQLSVKVCNAQLQDLSPLGDVSVHLGCLTTLNLPLRGTFSLTQKVLCDLLD